MLGPFALYDCTLHALFNVLKRNTSAHALHVDIFITEHWIHTKLMEVSKTETDESKNVLFTFVIII